MNFYLAAARAANNTATASKMTHRSFEVNDVGAHRMAAQAHEAAASAHETTAHLLDNDPDAVAVKNRAEHMRMVGLHRRQSVAHLNYQPQVSQQLQRPQVLMPRQ